MADLTTTITENVVLNGSVRGSTNTLTTTNIVDVFERILTLDVENCKYLRVTNLSDDQDMKVAFVTSATNYQVTVRAGGSHILFQAEEALIGEEDASPAFPTLQDIVTVEVRPAATTDVQVEVFAALV